jgi:alkanesulfonate monooxygenase SsuD/methylene tetrahydromethanopterin reductase-like flavin-dependent oxidoreductase (luciferase family)
MPEPKFGFSLLPTTDVAEHVDLVRTAEAAGLDWVGIQDHPYVPTYVDTFTLAGHLLAHTDRIALFPDVANLPLRPPAMLAKAAAALDILSAGRFELALGAGGYWDAITRMGVERLSSASANDALAEAIPLLRSLWQPGRRHVTTHGRYYSVDGLASGPVPAHGIEIWVGAVGPKALALTGRLADGWAAPIPSYLPYEKWPAAHDAIDAAATAAGRDPRAVRRIAQIVGTITDRPGDTEAHSGDAPVRGTPEQWADLVVRLVRDRRFTDVVFWPEEQSVDQVTTFAREVVPASRGAL